MSVEEFALIPNLDGNHNSIINLLAKSQMFCSYNKSILFIMPRIPSFRNLGKFIAFEPEVVSLKTGYNYELKM